MQYELLWGGDAEDLRVVTSGKATNEALLAYGRAIREHANFRPGLRILVDHRNTDLSQLSTEAFRQRADQIVRDGTHLNGHRIAILVATAADFGLARMTQGLAASQYDTDVERGVFRDIKQARDWLADPTRNIDR